MDTTFKNTEEKTTKKTKLVLAIFLSLVILIGVIGLFRFLYAQWVIGQSVLYGIRYATTGSYDLQYCIDLDGDNTPCDGDGGDAEVDVARIPSIKEVVRQQLASIHYNENTNNTNNTNNTTPDFLKVTVCTFENGYYFTYAPANGFENMDCVPSENAGQPGDSVIVAINYNFVLLDVSFLGIHPILIHISSSRTGVVEEFRSTELVNTPVPIATPVIPNNTPSSEVGSQLLEIDAALNESMQSSFAFNVPDRMKLNDTTAIELLLNPSISNADLGEQVSENGAIETGTLEISPLMKAELIAQDPDAFSITQIPENSEQLISATDTTKWTWVLTAKKKGMQTLTLVVYRLVQFQGQDYWREVQTYKTNIVVNVTVAQRIESFDWKWLAGILITALLIPAFWRWIDRRKKETVPKPDSKVGKRSKPVPKKAASKGKTK